MKEVMLNDLPRYSPWVMRLLGLEPYNRQVRDLAKVDQEYDKDKYAKLLAYYKANGTATLLDLKAQESPIHSNGQLCVSMDNRLFLTTPAECQRAEDQTLIGAIKEARGATSTIIELGCGYGYNLGILREQLPNCTFIGGDYSTNAVELGTMLFRGDVVIRPFNFYDSRWPILEDICEPAIIFTKHAIEQLPAVRSVLPTILKYKGRVQAVIHLEPVYEMNRDTTLGLLRRAYAVMNDYNRDLHLTLKDIGADIQLMQYDIYGSNPLNPTSLVRWVF